MASAQKEEKKNSGDSAGAAEPKTSRFFQAMRTNAYQNLNNVSGYVEFWVAMRVDRDQDKWRVMHYMIYNLDEADGKFKAEVLNPKGDLTFLEAVGHIANLDQIAGDQDMAGYKIADMSQYPADKYPELKAHFFDIEHYRTAAHIEGLSFDDANQPYARVEGKVIVSSVFRRSEAGIPALDIEQARQNPKIAARIEDGILSDVFNSASHRQATLESILKVGQLLSCMDAFAAQMGAFYLGVQKALGQDDKFDKIEGLSLEDKKAAYDKAAAEFWAVSASSRSRQENVLTEMTLILLPEASQKLDEAAQLGVHVEPFRKYLAECELYANLLQASQTLQKLEKGLASISTSADPRLITSIRQSVEAAQKKFIELGGSKEQFDRLQAWVANPKKDPVPKWLYGFLSRYYDQRQKAMKKVQERQAGPAAAQVMPAKVKPPIVE